jgi:lysophospholipase L1-like esterase
MRFRGAAVRWSIPALLAVTAVGALIGAHALAPGSSAHSADGPSGAQPSATPSPTPSHTSNTPGTPTATAATPARHTVLALGDSVPSGRNCDCSPFPQTYGAMLSRSTGARVTVDNRAVSGEDTTGLISQLQTPAVANAARRADVFLITIGANDFGDHHDEVVSGACEAGNSDCVSDEIGTMKGNLTSVLARIRALRNGAPSTILVTGYWNVFEDGDVARRAYGNSGLQASLQLTRRANAAIQSVATATGARYVDLLAPFQQAGKDITTLLAADGDHPDAAGHQLIAQALLDAGLPRTS